MTTTEENKPLVSIIVRTKDRPELLQNALRSIASQTYRPIEVILINDGGCSLPVEKLHGTLEDISLNYINLKRNTGRAHAGTTGIENAAGAYTGFLDDDDEYYPEHLESLVSRLQQDNCKIVYSAVESIDKKIEGGRTHLDCKIVFARKFSYEDLLIANYIPLISLLFESNLLKTLMFDESFELYEDWDLLIRAGENNTFCFVNKVTAAYYQWSNLQIAFKSSPEAIKQSTIQIYHKHLNKFTPSLIYRLSAEEWIHRPEVAELKQTIHDKEMEIRTSGEKIQLLEAQAVEKEEVINTIINTKGWKYLVQYRRLRDWIKSVVLSGRKV